MKSSHHFANRLSMSQKIASLMAVVVFGFVAVVGVAIVQVTSVVEKSERVASINLPLIQSISHIGSLARSQYLDAHRVVTSKRILHLGNSSAALNPPNRERFIANGLLLQQAIAQLETDIRILSNTQDTDPSMVAEHKGRLLPILFELRRSSQGYQLKVERLILHQLSTIELAVVSDQLDTLETAINQQINDFDDMVSVINLDTVNEIVYEEKVAIGLIILTTLLVLAIVLTITYVIVRNVIAKPLQQLTDTINVFTPFHKVDETEFEKSIILRQDELGRMGRSFNRLKHDLWNQGEDLAKAIFEAERANRAKSVFLASASHDLRQPLNAMQMYIAALRVKVDDPVVVNLVDDIDAVSVSTTRLLNALLDVSQLEAGAIQPHKESFCVSDLLRSLVQAYNPAAEKKGIRLRMVDCKLYLYSDIALLERILGNFISNALRYTQAGTVLVGCRRHEHHVSIEVMDTGCGIPEHQLVPIFDDFHQLNNSERDRSKGLGLGLAIAKRLSLCLDHDIECESIEGKGSRFSVQVDIGQKPKDQPTSIPVNMGVKSLTGMRLLLIEDNVDVQKATTQLLESWGCVVFGAKHADQATAWAAQPKQQVPHLIVADNRLPGAANGVEVAQKVCEIMDCDIPTIIVTGDVDDNNLQKIRQQGYLVLCKPVRPAKLRAAISNYA